jgi:protease I
MTDPTPRLDGLQVAVLVANEGIEQVELTEPWQALVEAGATPVLIAPDAGDVQAFDHLTAADTFEATVATADADPDDYAALVLPGGVANPDQLRTDDDAVEFVRAFAATGMPIAAICHAPWTLVEAGVVDGRTLTSWPSLQTDIRNAGGSWIDDEVVVCTDGRGPLITSRNPDDLPAFNRELLAALDRIGVRS